MGARSSLPTRARANYGDQPACSETRASPRPSTDGHLSREELRQVETIRTAWRKASVAQKRAIVSDLASEARLAAGQPVTFTWRTAEELAEELP
jgi:hypothetical protein